MTRQVKLVSRVFQFVLMAALIFFCFGVPLLILAGIDLPFPLGRRMRQAFPSIYLSIWWGRIVYAAVWLVFGWLIFWFIVLRSGKQTSTSVTGIKAGWPIKGRLRSRSSRSRNLRNEQKKVTPEIQWDDAEEPSPLAVKCGRIVFCFAGAVLLLISAAFSYDNPQSNVMLTASCMLAGLLAIWFGISLPPKIVAHFGFWLPWFLPNG